MQIVTIQKYSVNDVKWNMYAAAWRAILSSGNSRMIVLHVLDKSYFPFTVIPGVDIGFFCIAVPYSVP